MDCLIEEIFDKKGQVANTHSSLYLTTWLTALPIQEHGFALHFRDAISLRYGWPPTNLSSQCVCSTSLSVEHALNCKCGGFPSLRHNEVRDITAV